MSRVQVTSHAGRGFIASANLRGLREVYSDKWGRKKYALEDLAKRLVGLLNEAYDEDGAKDNTILDLRNQVEVAARSAKSPEQLVLEVQFLKNRALRAESLRDELRAELARAKDELRLAKQQVVDAEYKIPEHTVAGHNIQLRGEVETLKTQLAEKTADHDSLHATIQRFQAELMEWAVERRR